MVQNFLIFLLECSLLWLVSQLRARQAKELQRISVEAERAREAATRQAELALNRHLRVRSSALALEQQRQGRAVVRRATAKALAAVDVCALCVCVPSWLRCALSVLHVGPNGSRDYC